MENIFVSTVGGCQNSPMAFTTLTVNQPTIPQLIQSGDTLFTNAVAVSYQWYLAGNPIPGADSSFYVPLSSGLYSVMTTDSNGCSAASALFNFIVSGFEGAGSQVLYIYPNPFEDILTIKISEFSDDATLTVSDFTGREVVSVKAVTGINNINTVMLASGAYLLKIEDSSGIVYRRLIKK